MNDLPSLSEISRTLYTAVLSDVLDEFGFMGQALKPFARPLDGPVQASGGVLS
jgi:hypothetical protein